MLRLHARRAGQEDSVRAGCRVAWPREDVRRSTNRSGTRGRGACKRRGAALEHLPRRHGDTEEKSGDRDIGSSELSEEDGGKTAMASTSDDPMTRSPDDPIFLRASEPPWKLCARH